MHRDFKGVWVSKELWLRKDISITKRMFLVEIDSLNFNGKGCFASLKHFAEFSGLSKNRCSEIITELLQANFLTATYEQDDQDNPRRVLRLTEVFEKSKVCSETRTGCSETRTGCSETRTGCSETRTPIKDEEYLINTMRETRAIDFLKENNLSQWETFCMQYKSQIDDFVKFSLDFNDVYDDENKPYEVGAIVRRLGRYARNWVAFTINKKYNTPTPALKLKRLN